MTAAFLHSPGQYLHIVFNMVALWFVGPTLENTLGRARYITLYLMSAVGGSVGSVLLASATHSWATASVGASGAVFGLFGAILVISKRLGGDVRGILVLIGINLALGFVMANIAWQAHVGGLVTGGLLAAAYAYAPPDRREARRDPRAGGARRRCSSSPRCSRTRRSASSPSDAGDGDPARAAERRRAVLARTAARSSGEPVSTPRHRPHRYPHLWNYNRVVIHRLVHHWGQTRCSCRSGRWLWTSPRGEGGDEADIDERGVPNPGSTKAPPARCGRRLRTCDRRQRQRVVMAKPGDDEARTR